MKSIIELQCQLGELQDAIYWMSDPFHKGSFWEDLGKQRYGSLKQAQEEYQRLTVKIESLKKKPEEFGL